MSTTTAEPTTAPLKFTRSSHRRQSEAANIDTFSEFTFTETIYETRGHQRKRAQTMEAKVSGPLVALLAYGCFLSMGLALAESPSAAVASISRGPDSAADLQRSEALEAGAMEPATPRQYFKIHITPGHQRRHLRQSSPKRRATGGHKQPEVNLKPKISNAALKKLLNQSLMLRAGGSEGQSSINSLNSANKSNFKFVFIQRAAPSSPSTSTTSATSSSAASSSSTEMSTSSKTTRRPEAAKGANHESLAASVSKQLASSLLSSAAQLVGNLTAASSSSAPSLSALATQLAAKKETKGANSVTTSTGEDKNGSSADASTASETTQSTGHKKDSHAPLSTSINTKTRQPSKIYNLPVKFVGNAQPYGVQMFSQLKKHFASIKKLQQLNDKNSIGRLHSPGDFRPAATGGANGSSQKQLKVKQQQAIYKLKGQSRLIYLPLKYLSNAKPVKVTTASGQHQQHRSAPAVSRR